MDPFPENELKKRVTANSENNNQSGFQKVSIISNNNNDSKNINKNTNSSSTDDYKYLNSNKNTNNSQNTSSLAQRQTSLVPDNIPLIMHTKRWHSLDCGTSGLGCDRVSYDENILLQNKKSLGRSSIKSWLIGKIFPNNGYTPRASNTSLRKIGLMPAGSTTDTLRKPDSESIV